MYYVAPNVQSLDDLLHLKQKWWNLYSTRTVLCTSSALYHSVFCYSTLLLHSSLCAAIVDGQNTNTNTLLFFDSLLHVLLSAASPPTARSPLIPCFTSTNPFFPPSPSFEWTYFLNYNYKFDYIQMKFYPWYPWHFVAWLSSKIQSSVHHKTSQLLVITLIQLEEQRRLSLVERSNNKVKGTSGGKVIRWSFSFILGPLQHPENTEI